MVQSVLTTAGSVILARSAKGSHPTAQRSLAKAVGCFLRASSIPTAGAELLSCAFAGNRTMVGGDASGHVHFLRLEEPKLKT